MASSSPDVLTLGGSVLAENTRQAAGPAGRRRAQRQLSRRTKSSCASRIASRRCSRSTSQPAFLASEKFDELVFGDHPYRYIAPTVESIDRMDQKSMIKFRDTYLVPNNAVLVLLGKLPARRKR